MKKIFAVFLSILTVLSVFSFTACSDQATETGSITTIERKTPTAPQIPFGVNLKTVSDSELNTTVDSINSKYSQLSENNITFETYRYLKEEYYDSDGTITSSKSDEVYAQTKYLKDGDNVKIELNNIRIDAEINNNSLSDYYTNRLNEGYREQTVFYENKFAGLLQLTEEYYNRGLSETYIKTPKQLIETVVSDIDFSNNGISALFSLFNRNKNYLDTPYVSDFISVHINNPESEYRGLSSFADVEIIDNAKDLKLEEAIFEVKSDGTRLFVNVHYKTRIEFEDGRYIYDENNLVGYLDTKANLRKKDFSNDYLNDNNVDKIRYIKFDYDNAVKNIKEGKEVKIQSYGGGVPDQLWSELVSGERNKISLVYYKDGMVAYDKYPNHFMYLDFEMDENGVITITAETATQIAEVLNDEKSAGYDIVLSCNFNYGDPYYGMCYSSFKLVLPV